MTPECPLCGELWVVYTTGSNLHLYEVYQCPQGHEWAVPYTSERVAYWRERAIEWAASE